MFTGIVQATGEVLAAGTTRDGWSLWIASRVLDGRDLGASVAVNGVCLTVAERRGSECRFDVSKETAARTTVAGLGPGACVNVELPLRAGDELGGHIVQGHVDGVARVHSVADDDAGRRLRIELPPQVARYVVEKGSITVDGVSLTVAAISDAVAEIALVPHTLEVTTLSEAGVGDAVNIEVDVIAKYVERLTDVWRRSSPVGEVPPEVSGYL